MATHEQEPRDVGGWERQPLTRRVADRAGEAQSLWYESPAQVDAGLRQTAQRAALMRWVNRQMKRRLTSQERRCVELYYLEEKSFREIGEDMEISAAAVARVVSNGIAKLRAAARKKNRANQKCKVKSKQ